MSRRQMAMKDNVPEWLSQALGGPLKETQEVRDSLWDLAQNWGSWLTLCHSSSLILEMLMHLLNRTLHLISIQFPPPLYLGTTGSSTQDETKTDTSVIQSLLALAESDTAGEENVRLKTVTIAITDQTRNIGAPHAITTGTDIDDTEAMIWKTKTAYRDLRRLSIPVWCQTLWLWLELPLESPLPSVQQDKPRQYVHFHTKLPGAWAEAVLAANRCCRMGQEHFSASTDGRGHR